MARTLLNRRSVARSPILLASKSDRPVPIPGSTGDGLALHTADSAVFAGLCRTLQASGVRVSTQGPFDTTRASPAWSQVCCVLVDLDQPKVSGVSIIRRVRQQNALLPIIFVAEKPVLRDVVDSMKTGAFDFFEKPFDASRLATRVEEAVLSYRRLQPVLAEISRIEQLIIALTKRERQLFDLVLAGKSTKEIAYDLGIRDVTVDFHRRNLYRKMKVNNAVNLAIIIENYRHERMKVLSALPPA